MNDRLTFTANAWEDYRYWETEDRKTLNRINRLIMDIQRNGISTGIGKPEPLRYRPGWSRRIDEANRLTYEIDHDSLIILGCRGHYED